jgi:hypothetical protein
MPFQDISGMVQDIGRVLQDISGPLHDIGPIALHDIDESSSRYYM